MRTTLLAVAAMAVMLTACQEKLTAPGDCPGLCPSDNLVVEDVILPAATGLDSTFTGFVDASRSSRLRLANGLAGESLLGIVRFVRRGDSIDVRDTARAFVVDSVTLSVTVEGRDPAVTGLSLEIYKLPATVAVDSTTTYAEVDGALAPERLIETVPIPDALTRGTLSVVLSGAELAAIEFTPEDEAVLRLAYRLVAPQPAGVLLAATGTGGPAFLSAVRVELPDTTVRQTLPRIIAFATTVDATPDDAPPPDLLTIGGAPSSRAILRFPLPLRIRDSAQILRATLRLVPISPIEGMPGDSAFLDVRGVFSDLGAKSPRISNEDLAVRQRLTLASTDTVAIEVTRIVRLWTSPTRAPSALFVAMSPEAATFFVAEFGSTRTPGAVPTLRITYALPYPFEAQ